MISSKKATMIDEMMEEDTDDTLDVDESHEQLVESLFNQALDKELPSVGEGVKDSAIKEGRGFKAGARLVQ